MWSDADNTLVSTPSASDAERLSELHPASPLPQDPFDNLPSETIVDIFSYAYPVVNLPAHMDPPRQYAPRFPDLETLSAVCKRWRAIALSNPSLWATLTIKARKIQRKDWRRWGLLQLHSCLGGSGAYPLNIRIDSRDSSTDMAEEFMQVWDADLFMRDHETIDGIIHIILLQSERWRRIEFDLTTDPQFFQMFGALKGHLPFLEHLDINLCRDRYFGCRFTGTSVLNAPKLTSISICSSLGLKCLQKIQINWKQISELTFSTSDFRSKANFHKILGWLSGSLTSLIFSGSYNNQFEDSVGEHSRPTTLTPLRRLCFVSKLPGVLDMLTCPSLKELELNDGAEREITSFLDRSSCALTSIKLHRLPSPAYHTILQHTSLLTLKHLSLSDITDEDLDILNLDTHHLFPSLESLSLRLCFRRLFHHSQLVYQIQSGPSSRIPRSHRAFDGRQLLASQIQTLRKVVYSRTCSTIAFHQPKSSVEGIQSDKIQRDATCSLKKCLFSFDLHAEGPDGADYWNEDPIYALRSFCIRRNIVTSVKISYPKDIILIPLNSDEFPFGVYGAQ